MSFLVKLSHKFFPLFNRFSTFHKKVNLSKANPEAENPFLDLPLAKYLDFFYDVSKNSEHINTFRGVRLKKSPFQIPKLNFLEQKKANPQNGKSHFFSIMANEIFYPKVTGKKIIWSNSFKSFKDTISKTNTCFRQHHDFFRKTFPFWELTFESSLSKRS